jgi:fucose 4-O-acetylase-like acetyltransferase
MKSPIATAGTTRFEFVDALRGFAIVLVVLGHALQYGAADPDENALFRLIYAFHMPLFMFISGFVYSGAKRSVSEEVRLKSRSLLRPFLAWLPITYLWVSFGPTPMNAPDFALRVIAAPDAGGLWFLWVLYLINLMVLTCRQFAPRSAMVTAWGLWGVLSAIVLVRSEWNVLGLKLLCWHLPFFLLGMAFRKADGMSHLHPVSALVCGLLFFATLPLWVRTGPSPFSSYLGSLPGAASTLVVRSFSYLIAVLAILATFSLFNSLAQSIRLQTLSRLGRISLEIYATHIYFLAAAVAILASSPLPEQVRVALVFMTGLAGAICCTWAIKRNLTLASLMFGSRHAAPLPLAQSEG